MTLLLFGCETDNGNPVCRIPTAFTDHPPATSLTSRPRLPNGSSYVTAVVNRFGASCVARLHSLGLLYAFCAPLIDVICAAPAVLTPNTSVADRDHVYEAS